MRHVSSFRRPFVFAAAALVLLATSLAVPATPAAAAPAADPEPDNWITNGRVRALARIGDHVYLGGSFTRVGPPTGHAVVVDATDASAQPEAPHVNGVVFDIAADGTGGWYLGGQFSAVNGVGRSNVAHVLADGTLSDWHPFTNGTVRAIAVSGGRVFLGGDFSNVRTVARQRLAAVRADNGVVINSWNPGANGRVHDLVVVDGGAALVAGGEFTNAGGVPRQRIASISTASGNVQALFGAATNGTVFTLAASSDGERVYAGGTFGLSGVVPRSNIAAFDASTGGLDLTFDPGANGPVRAIAVAAEDVEEPEDPEDPPPTPNPANDTVFYGGSFTRAANTARRHLASVDTSGVARAWAPFATGAVESLAVSPSGDDLLAGGFFASINRTPAVFAARISTTSGQALESFDLQADGVVRAAQWLDDDAIALGGGFSSVGSVRQPFLARLHADTGELDTSWRPTLNEYVLDLKPDPSGSRLYVVGRFTAVNGQSRGRGASFNPDTGQLLGWNPGADEQVLVVEPTAGDVYLGGQFTELRGDSLHRFVGRTDRNTGAPDGSWRPLPNGSVRAIDAQPGQPVYVGGSFTLLGVVPRARIAAIADNGLVTGFDPGSPQIVLDLHSSSATGLLYAAIGGNTNNGGNGVAAYRTTGSGSVRWKHQGNGDVQVVHAGDDGNVYIGGHFRHMRTPADRRLGMASFDAATGALQPFAPQMYWNDLGVWAVEWTPEGLLVGGDQTRVGRLGLRGYAVFPEV